MGSTNYKPAIVRAYRFHFKMLTKLFITLFLAVSVAQSFIVPNSEASNFLSRKRRANGPLEEALPSNIKRECQKEQCDFEEYVEAKENETKKDGIKLREVVKNHSQMKAEFEQIYTYCYKQVKKDSELADKNMFNFLPKCLEVLEKEFKNKGYFDKQPDTNDNGNDQTDYYGGNPDYYGGNY